MKVATVVMLVVSSISKSAPETLGKILSTGFCVELGAVGELPPLQARLVTVSTTANRVTQRRVMTGLLPGTVTKD